MSLILVGTSLVLIGTAESDSTRAPHAPIYIRGNAEFDAAHGVRSGNGSVSNPFVIEGWYIDIWESDGIVIKDTNAHFVVRNVSLSSFNQPYFKGIVLDNASNGRIEHVGGIGNDIGAFLTRSSDIRIENSSFSGNRRGVMIESSSRISLMRNNASSLDVNSSDFISLMGNRASGIDLYDVRNASVWGNDLRRNGVSAVGSTNITIRGNAVRDALVGISLSSSRNVEVRNNSIIAAQDEAFDDAGLENRWDGGPSIGGNYWSSYSGEDHCSGQSQDNCAGPDGFGDSPYVIDDDSIDRYPLMVPPGATPGLRLDITTDRAIYLPGEPVVIVMTLSNLGDRPVDFVFRGCWKTFWIYDSTGKLLYREDRHRACIAMTTGFTLLPNQSLPLWSSWDQTDDAGEPVPAPGAYTVRGRMEDARNIPTTPGLFDILEVPLGLIPRAPILISGNAEFISRNGVTRGNGSASNPYVVEGWNIDASAAPGIVVQNTTAHFRIQNVYVRSGGTTNAGISLRNVSHARVAGALLIGNARGIAVDRGTDVSVEHNTVISSAADAVAISRTSDARIAGNRVSRITNQAGTGFVIAEATDVEIVSNTVIGNSLGVALERSSDVVVAHNNLLGNFHDASDDRGAENQWDRGYPIGGNFWAGSPKQDLCSGPNQTDCGPSPDGIADAPDYIDMDSRDRYPLMAFHFTDHVTPEPVLQLSDRQGSGRTVFVAEVSLTADRGLSAPPFLVQWDWEGDGSWDTPWSVSARAEHRYTKPGSYDLRARVSFVRMGPAILTAEIVIWNERPNAAFAISGALVRVGDLITVDASGSSDLEDAAERLEIRWDWEDDGTWDTGWSVEKEASHRFSEPGAYTVRLEVRDSLGITSSATDRIEVRALTFSEVVAANGAAVAVLSLGAIAGAAIAAVLTAHHRRNKRKA